MTKKRSSNVLLAARWKILRNKLQIITVIFRYLVHVLAICVASLLCCNDDGHDCQNVFYITTSVTYLKITTCDTKCSISYAYMYAHPVMLLGKLLPSVLKYSSLCGFVLPLFHIVIYFSSLYIILSVCCLDTGDTGKTVAEKRSS